jgi:hypothetical protein
MRFRLIGTALLGAYLALRPPMLRWGATEEESRRRLPGADVIPDARRTSSTMAVTIDAPPHRVWPWLVQMGCDRAGWYSYDRLDNGGRPSSEEIVPAWQNIEVGDRIQADTKGAHWFTVAHVDPERSLVLRSSNELPGGRPFDPAGPRPRWFSDTTWEFVLEPAGADQTRLVVGGMGAGRPWLVDRLAALLFWEPAHFVMQRRQFAEIARRAEGRPIPEIREEKTPLHA